MRCILITTLLLLTCNLALAAEPVTILDIKEQHGAITAHFKLGGTTIILDEKGQPQVSPVDRLQATLSIESPETLSLTLPTFQDSTFGDFTLLDRGKISRERTDIITTTASWIIEPYNEGEYSLPPLSISGIETNGNTEKFTLTLPAIQVTSQTTTTTGFDILPPREIKKDNTLRVILIISGVVLVLYLLSLIVKAKRRPTPLSPKLRALAELSAITGSSTERTKALSHITRCFLDTNFTLCVMEKTHDEYEPFIQNHPMIKNGATILAILKTCDQTNYSGTPITDPEIDSLIQQSHEFIVNCAEPLRPEEDSRTCGKW